MKFLIFFIVYHLELLKEILAISLLPPNAAAMKRAKIFQKSLIALSLIGSGLLLFTCNLKSVAPRSGLNAKFSVAQSGCIAPCDPGFQNLSTNAASYIWSFGNGDSSTEANPSYTYIEAGTFQVNLTAKDANGASDDTTIEVLINPSDVLIASFEASFSNNGYAPSTVSFTNTSQNASSFHWDFDNGNASLDETPPDQVYSMSGNYSVTLTVEDDELNSDDTTIVLTINETPTYQLNVKGSSCQFYRDVVETERGEILVMSYGDDTQISRFNRNGGILGVTPLIGKNILRLQNAQNQELIGIGSIDGDTSNISLIRLDSNLNVLSDISVGNEPNIAPVDFIQLPNGYIFLCNKYYSAVPTDADLVVIRTDLSGNVIWKETAGGTKRDRGADLLISNNNTLLVVGTTESDGFGESDIWLLTYSLDGTLLDEETYGSFSEYESASSIIQISSSDPAFNNDIIICGARSECQGFGCDDAYILRLNESGNIVKELILGDDGMNLRDDAAASIVQTEDDQLVFGGSTRNYGVVFYGMWMVKLDKELNTVWNKTFDPGNEEDYASKLFITQDNGFILAGYSQSSVVNGCGVVVVKTDSEGNQ